MSDAECVGGPLDGLRVPSCPSCDGEPLTVDAPERSAAWPQALVRCSCGQEYRLDLYQAA